jgi:acyl-CoA thioesterase-1
LTPTTSRRRLLATALLAAALAACGKKAPKGRAVPRGANVLALGDSITYGTGATPETSYPTVLAALTGWNVINAGVPGNTSAQALERLPGLLQEHKPELVIVSVGGNDFLRGVSAATTKGNIASTCREALASGAQVLLVAVPQPNLMAAVAKSLSDHAMYEELAKELKVPLHAGGWGAVLGDATLRSDPIHANGQGYEKFARGLYETAKEAGLAK